MIAVGRAAAARIHQHSAPVRVPRVPVRRVHRRAGLARAPRRRTASIAVRRATADSGGGDGDGEPPLERARGPPKARRPTASKAKHPGVDAPWMLDPVELAEAGATSNRYTRTIAPRRGPEQLLMPKEPYARSAGTRLSTGCSPS
jgi:hypothetical protein